MPTPNDPGVDKPQAAKRRLRGLAVHLLTGTVLAVAAVIADVAADGMVSWSALLIVGWGGVLALHVGYAMGLFDGLLPRRRE